jgi:hypothetical protein
LGIATSQYKVLYNCLQTEFGIQNYTLLINSIYFTDYNLE